MTNGNDSDDEALTWLIRTNDSAFDQWDEFTQWLESNSEHAVAYHRLAGAERDLLPLVARASLPASLPMRTRTMQTARRWTVAAVAAGVFAVSTVSVITRLAPVSYATQPGELRRVELGGEDRLVMNGGTRLEIAGWDRRSISLAQGQILLSLHEPGASPIEVQAGDLQLVDVGTVFEVARDGRATRVVVAEGEVVADPEGAALRLPRGTMLDAKDGQAVLRTTKAEVIGVGAWADGQLIYSGASLGELATDLRRTTGIEIRIDPSAASRSFTGTLSVSEVRRDPRSLEPLLGVKMRQSGAGWIVTGGEG